MVIGAMLVAPLMTTIFSLSVALIRGRVRLLERGIGNLLRRQTGQEVTLEIRYVGPLPAREKPPAESASPPP